VREVACTSAERRTETSKLHLREALLDGLNLAKLAWQTKHFQRLAKFCGVGFSGVGMSLGMLWVLREFTALPLGLCGALAVWSAMLSNFTLNEFWTFADWSRLAPGLLQRLTRLGKYFLICTGGGIVNVSTLVLLNRLVSLHYLLSGAAGIGLAILWNYGWNANLTWQPPPRGGSVGRFHG